VLWLFLVAYWCSGFAGLIYEVCWTRLLTLFLGHSTAAASAVVAAFLGGLAVGAALGGPLAARLSRSRSLYAYVGLELGVAMAAVLLPFETRALTPLLRSAYANGGAGLAFPAIRLLACLLMVFVPAAALGATFPIAIRWFAGDSANPARRTGWLYAVNTAGAAIGALAAGFVLIPRIGLSGTTRIGIAASAVAALSVFGLTLLERRPQPEAIREAATSAPPPKETRKRRSAKPEPAATPPPLVPAWLTAIILGVSGFAALIHEIAWTRILSLVLGPTIYAFSATVAAVIAGVAIGSALGTWIGARSHRRLAWLMAALVGAALTNSWTASLAGTTVPTLVAHYMATSSIAFNQLLQRGTLLTAALIIPTAICFGAAFPLGLAAIRASAQGPRQFADVYAANTAGAVAGALMCGFVLIPQFGLHATLGIVTGSLIAATAAILMTGRPSPLVRTLGTGAAVAAGLILIYGPPWDRELLASGAYLYAPYVPKNLDLESQLRAGTLLYDHDGAAATVSVKRLTGTMTLAVDGKVDASNRSDMLTQKLVAHLPLLLHDNPRDVAVIGLGSGVTVGAALRHPVSRVDVVELSPEVVEASHFFDTDNQHALADPRTHLIVGDGRSHLLLSTRQYDVIISEPSNPWIAGVAALFTREFFQMARARLAPHGMICQWAHTYNISDADLRAIVTTFTSVFPNATLSLVGGDDVILVASNDDSDDLHKRWGSDIGRNWQRPGVAADLATVGASEPFSVSSLFIGGPPELLTYTAVGEILTDDRMALEFSGPRALHESSAEENGNALSLLQPDNARDAASKRDPDPDSHLLIDYDTPVKTAELYRQRAAMLFKADAYASAYRDYMKALTIDSSSKPALDGFVKSGVLAGRGTEAIAWLKARPPLLAPPGRLVAISKLQSSNDLGADALDTAKQAVRLTASDPDAFEQLASVAADAGDTAQLDEALGRLQTLAPNRAGTLYFSAVSAFVHGRVDEAVGLAERAIAADKTYAPVYDLVGAAYTKLDRPADAKKAFETSLGFDAHDSTAYTNLGLLELAAGNRRTAADYFAEALGLAPNSEVAREGLARAQ
jgi:spermidine synthase